MKSSVKILSVFLLLISLFLFACAAQINNRMASWERRHYHDLFAKWGPPQLIFEDGDGGRILIYTIKRQWTSPGRSFSHTKHQALIWDNWIWQRYDLYGKSSTYTIYKPPETHGYTAYRMFWIDEDGIIYKWTWKGY